MSATEREITAEEVMSWCQQFKIVNFIETSAKTSQNVTAAFTMAVRHWQKSEQLADRIAENDTIDLIKTVQLNDRNKSSCCVNVGSLPSRKSQNEAL